MKHSKQDEGVYSPTMILEAERGYTNVRLLQGTPSIDERREER